MTFEEFKSSVTTGAEPSQLRGELCALWHEARGDWDAAHGIVQDMTTREAAWVHAYLHRKEGDAGNAAYWYARADRPLSKESIEREWEAMVRELLG